MSPPKPKRSKCCRTLQTALAIQAPALQPAVQLQDGEDPSGEVMKDGSDAGELSDGKENDLLDAFYESDIYVTKMVATPPLRTRPTATCTMQ